MTVNTQFDDRKWSLQSWDVKLLRPVNVSVAFRQVTEVDIDPFAPAPEVARQDCEGNPSSGGCVDSKVVVTFRNRDAY